MTVLASSELLTFRDFVLLSMVLSYNRSTSRPPTHNKLRDLINTFLRDCEIGLDKATPLTGNYLLQEDVKKLRTFGLMTPEGSYRLTSAGTFLLSLYPDWHDYPTALEFNVKETY